MVQTYYLPLLLPAATAATILVLFAEVELVGDAESGGLVVEDHVAVGGLVWRGIGGGRGTGGSVGGGGDEGVLHRPIALLIVLAPVVVLQKAIEKGFTGVSNIWSRTLGLCVCEVYSLIPYIFSLASTEVDKMVHSRFGEVCSCCCLPALPGPA